MAIHEFDQVLGDRKYPSLQFATRTNPLFTEWHSCFYENRQRVLPANFDELLSPLALAVWLMDDGAADHHGVTIQTHSFREEEVERIVSTLGNRFGLMATSRKNKGGYVAYVRASSVDRLNRIVGSFFLEGLKYKLTPISNRTP